MRLKKKRERFLCCNSVIVLDVRKRGMGEVRATGQKRSFVLWSEPVPVGSRKPLSDRNNTDTSLGIAGVVRSTSRYCFSFHKCNYDTRYMKENSFTENECIYSLELKHSKSYCDKFVCKYLTRSSFLL